MSRFHFNIKFVQDTLQPNETEEERYQRLTAEYKEKQQVFIDLDLILNDKHPIKRLDVMLADQKVELKYRNELVSIFRKSLQKTKTCDGLDFNQKVT